MISLTGWSLADKLTGESLMGAWDATLFGNDDAADFCHEFDNALSAGAVAPILEAALDAVLATTAYVEVSEASVGIAAAALVVAWGEPELLGDIADAPQPWPRTKKWRRTKNQLPARLRTKAALVFDRVKEPVANELMDLWAESGQAFEFSAEVDRWRQRLP